MSPRPAECRDCHEPILFVRLIGGGVMPVNPRPGTDGNVIAELVGTRLSGWVESAAHPWRPGMDRYRPHFATCEENQRRKPATPKPPPDPELDLFNQPEETP